jgi:hypothetical protein
LCTKETILIWSLSATILERNLTPVFVKEMGLKSLIFSGEEVFGTKVI